MKKMIGKGLSIVVSLGMLFTMTFNLGPTISGEGSTETTEVKETVVQENVDTNPSVDQSQTIEPTTEKKNDNSKNDEAVNVDNSETKDSGKPKEEVLKDEQETSKDDEAKEDKPQEDNSKNEQVKPEEKKQEENKDEKKPEVKLVDFHRDFQFDTQKVVVEGKLLENVQLDVTKVVPSKDVLDQISKTNKGVKSENVFMYALNIHSDKDNVELNQSVKVQISKAISEKASDVVVYAVQDNNVVLMDNVKVNKEDNTVSFETGKSLNVAVVSIVKEEKKEETPAPTTTPDSKENDKNAKPEEKKDNEVKKEEQSQDKKEDADKKDEKDVEKIESLTFTQTVSGKAIKIEGKFPQGTDVKITPVKFSELKEEVQNELKKQSAINQLDEKDFLAFDFDFFKGDKHDIQPEGQAKITINNVTDAKDQDAELKAFHIDDKNADKVNEVSVNKVGNDVQLTADSFSIYAIISEQTSETDGKIWINYNTKKTYPTIAQAIIDASQGDTVHITGNFGTKEDGFQGVTVTKNITLNVAEDTTFIGDGSSDGIILTDGSKLSTRFGSTLKMSNFNTAIVIPEGATVNSGNYNLFDNMRGIELSGTIAGERNRQSLVIHSTDKNPGNSDLSGKPTISNANVTLQAIRKGTFKASLKLDHASLTLTNFLRKEFQTLDMDNSNLSMGYDFGLVDYYDTAGFGRKDSAYFTGPATIKNQSRISFAETQGGGIVVDAPNTDINFIDSTLEGWGRDLGMNIEAGKVVFNHSNFYQTDMDSGTGASMFSLFGVKKDSGTLTIENGSYLEPAMSLGGFYEGSPSSFEEADNKIVITGTNYYSPGITDYKDGVLKPSGYDVPYFLNPPVNQDGDQLTLFELSSDLEAININYKGKSYDYVIGPINYVYGTHIWVPAVNVNFDFNLNELQMSAEEKKKISNPQTIKAIPGHLLSLAKKWNNVTNVYPTNPSVPGYAFKGWKLNGKLITDLKNFSTTEDVTLVAEWQKLNRSVRVDYHKQLDSDQAYAVYEEPNSENKIKLKTMDELAQLNPNFAVSLKFKGWSTTPDGKNMISNNLLELKDEDENGNTINVYAVYEMDRNLTISFNANRGQFKEEFIQLFKKDAITVDDNKEVVTLKKLAYPGEKLYSILKEALVNEDKLRSVFGSPVDGFGQYAERIEDHGKFYRFINEGSFYGEPKFYWYRQPSAKNVEIAHLGSETTINQKTTYYIGWNESKTDIAQFDDKYNIIYGLNPFADVLINNHTRTPVYVGKKPFSLTGRVDLSSLSKYINYVDERLHSDHPNVKTDEYKLNYVSSYIDYFLYLPDEAVLPDNFNDKWGKYVTLGGYNDSFKVKLVEQGVQRPQITDSRMGRYVRIVLEYFRKDSYEDFLKNMQGHLKGENSADASWLSLRIDGLRVKVPENSKQDVTFAETISGTFAYDVSVGKSKYYLTRTLKARQLPSGEDDKNKGACDPQARTGCSLIASVTTDNGNSTVNEPNTYMDILVENNTQNTSTYPVKLHDLLTYTTRYYISDYLKSVKELKDYKYDKSMNKFAARFTTEFKIDQDLSYPSRLDVNVYDLLADKKDQMPKYKSHELTDDMYHVKQVYLEYYRNDAKRHRALQKDKQGKYILGDLSGASDVKFFVVTEFDISKYLEKYGVSETDPNGVTLADISSRDYLPLNIGPFEVQQYGNKKTQNVTATMNGVMIQYSNNSSEANVNELDEALGGQLKGDGDPTNPGKISFTSEIMDDSVYYTPKVYKALLIELKWEGVDANLQKPVKVQLYQNGIPTDRYVTLDKDNEWMTVIDDLDYMDEFGQIIQYSVKEVNEVYGQVRIGNHYYKVNYDYDKDGKGVVITNTLVQKIPYTGDDNNVSLWFVTSIIAALLAISCVLVLRKSEQE